MPGQSQKYIDADTASAKWTHDGPIKLGFLTHITILFYLRDHVKRLQPSKSRRPHSFQRQSHNHGVQISCPLWQVRLPSVHNTLRQEETLVTAQVRNPCANLHVEGRIACPIQCPCLCETVMILQGFVLSVSISLEYSKWLSQCKILGSTAWKPCQQIDLLKQNTWALLTKLPMYLVLTHQY